jgi:hypothetical protein
MPNIPWPPRNRFICTRSAPRPGEAVVGDGGTIITQDFDRYPVARMQSVPVDAHGRCRSRPVRSSRSSPEGGDRNGNRATDAMHNRRKPS